VGGVGAAESRVGATPCAPHALVALAVGLAAQACGRSQGGRLTMPALAGFHRPRTVDEAIALLAQDPDAKPLAGGATLVAMMNARVIEPDALVGLAGTREIQGISALP